MAAGFNIVQYKYNTTQWMIFIKYTQQNVYVHIW